MQEHFVMALAERRLAVAADRVARILPLLPLWRSPTLPPVVAGFASVEGQVLPVLDLLRLLLPDRPRDTIDGFSHIVVPMGASPGRPCLLVDRVEARVAFADDAVEPVSAENSLNGVIDGAVSVDHGLLHRIDLDRLIDRGEQERLVELSALAAERAGQWQATGPA